MSDDCWSVWVTSDDYMSDDCWSVWLTSDEYMSDDCWGVWLTSDEYMSYDCWRKVLKPGFCYGWDGICTEEEHLTFRMQCSGHPSTLVTHVIITRQSKKPQPLINPTSNFHFNTRNSCIHHSSIKKTSAINKSHFKLPLQQSSNPNSTFRFIFVSCCILPTTTR
jgi:hypothetical protein